MRLNSNFTASETEYGKVLLDENKGMYFQLNATGALILDLLLSGHEEAFIAQQLADEFEVSLELAKADITELRLNLISKGVVEV